MLPFSEFDRILFVAPHPDDESLGGGGLLQRAFAAQIPVRILFATNGDNNPWAQRFWERRWKIGLDERRRWGERRKQEAIAAITALGGSPECARFLNFPDLGITSLLMRGARELLAVLANEIRAFKPSILVIPTVLDAHPDHSALSVAISLLLDSAENPAIQVREYLVHRPKVGIHRRPVILRLSPSEIDGKRNAIRCHETQMALSANRFMQFARAEEAFYTHAAVGITSDANPILKAQIREDVLNLVFSARRRERLGTEILLVFRSKADQMHRWRIRVSMLSGTPQIEDLISGKRLHDAVATWNRSSLTVGVPITGAPGVDALFVKLSSWTLFFDRSGWCEVVLTSDRMRSPRKRSSVPNLLTFL
jgi:LmbE family N-acetylglucosaminyl deacetylase